MRDGARGWTGLSALGSRAVWQDSPSLPAHVLFPINVKTGPEVFINLVFSSLPVHTLAAVGPMLNMFLKIF